MLKEIKRKKKKLKLAIQVPQFITLERGKLGL
jgi:hypothetical protein